MAADGQPGGAETERSIEWLASRGPPTATSTSCWFLAIDLLHEDLSVEVPEGAIPGVSKLTVATSKGQKIVVTVPMGATPGTKLDLAPAGPDGRPTGPSWKAARHSVRLGAIKSLKRTLAADVAVDVEGAQLARMGKAAGVAAAAEVVKEAAAVKEAAEAKAVAAREVAAAAAARAKTLERLQRPEAAAETLQRFKAAEAEATAAEAVAAAEKEVARAAVKAMAQAELKAAAEVQAKGTAMIASKTSAAAASAAAKKEAAAKGPALELIRKASQSELKADQKRSSRGQTSVQAVAEAAAKAQAKVHEEIKEAQDQVMRSPTARLRAAWQRKISELATAEWVDKCVECGSYARGRHVERFHDLVDPGEGSFYCHECGPSLEPAAAAGLELKSAFPADDVLSFESSPRSPKSHFSESPK